MKVSQLSVIFAVVFLHRNVASSMPNNASRTPGQALDSTIANLRKSLNVVQSSNDDLYGKYQDLQKEVNDLKRLHGPCDPCVEVKGENPHCDCTNLGAKQDCLEFYDNGIRVNGVYKLETTRFSTVNAFCDQTTQGGGWIVIQRRKDGSVDFDRTWSEYKDGFGKLTGEFWFGNENIYDFSKTSSSPKSLELLINMNVQGSNKTVYAKYSFFKISNEKAKYMLSLSGFSGTVPQDGLSAHNGIMFTTKDTDNDGYSGNCAAEYSGGWWFTSSGCYVTHLNGIYKFTRADNEMWWYWKTIQPDFVEMKTRRKK